MQGRCLQRLQGGQRHEGLGRHGLGSGHGNATRDLQSLGQASSRIRGPSLVYSRIRDQCQASADHQKRGSAGRHREPSIGPPKPPTRRDAGAPGESPHGNACNTTSFGLPPPRTPWSETPRETSSPPQNETHTSLWPCPRLEHLLEGVGLPLPPKEYRRLLKTVHTKTVATTTQSYPPSGVLGTRPPPVNVREEKTLPRRTRRTLSQLRSGYSQHLLSYRARLEPEQGSSCPLCHTAPHTTAHLFQCPTNPTNLPLTALWTNPVEAARFIDLAGVHPTM